MKTCFVISQIGEENSTQRLEADKVLKYVIKPSLEELGYKVVRADESTEAGSISKSVIQSVIESDLVIADLTNHNPNVFYELAIRHAIAKPFIQIIQKSQKIPFDIYDIRTIQYELDLEGAEKAKQSIIEFAKSLEGLDRVETPVTEVVALSSLNIVQPSNTSDGSNVLIEELQRINQSINNLEHKLAGRLEQMVKHNTLNESISMEDKLGMIFIEKLLDNPQKSDDMIGLISKLGSLNHKK
ncbi:hypothetical protein LAJ61_07185 [Moraxella osloensis]|nr:hypothetical protein [Moraxella osloensis]UAY36461.1 hypothetical protein LAJ61_07185 [Moraxella osloensis]